MTRSFTIHQEEVDDDYTYMSFDGHITRIIDVVTFYEHGKRSNEHCFYTDEEGIHWRNVVINKFMDNEE